MLQCNFHVSMGSKVELAQRILKAVAGSESVWIGVDRGVPHFRRVSIPSFNFYLEVTPGGIHLRGATSPPPLHTKNAWIALSSQRGRLQRLERMRQWLQTSLRRLRTDFYPKEGQPEHWGYGIIQAAQGRKFRVSDCAVYWPWDAASLPSGDSSSLPMSSGLLAALEREIPGSRVMHALYYKGEGQFTWYSASGESFQFYYEDVKEQVPTVKTVDATLSGAFQHYYAQQLAEWAVSPAFVEALRHNVSSSGSSEGISDILEEVMQTLLAYERWKDLP